MHRCYSKTHSISDHYGAFDRGHTFDSFMGMEI